jgi:hypothetical protein
VSPAIETVSTITKIFAARNKLTSCYVLRRNRSLIQHAHCMLSDSQYLRRNRVIIGAAEGFLHIEVLLAFKLEFLCLSVHFFIRSRRPAAMVRSVIKRHSKESLKKDFSCDLGVDCVGGSSFACERRDNLVGDPMPAALVVRVVDPWNVDSLLSLLADSIDSSHDLHKYVECNGELKDVDTTGSALKVDGDRAKGIGDK